MCVHADQVIMALISQRYVLMRGTFEFDFPLKVSVSQSVIIIFIWFLCLWLSNRHRLCGLHAVVSKCALIFFFFDLLFQGRIKAGIISHHAQFSLMSVTVLEFMWQRADAKTRCFRQNGGPPNDPLSRLCQG